MHLRNGGWRMEGRKGGRNRRRVEFNRGERRRRRGEESRRKNSNIFMI